MQSYVINPYIIGYIDPIHKQVILEHVLQFDQNWTFVLLNRWNFRSVRSRNNSHAFVTFVLFNLFLLSSFTWNQTNMKIWKQKYNICIIICFIRRANKDKNILFHQNWPFLDLLCILGFSRNDYRGVLNMLTTNFSKRKNTSATPLPLWYMYKCNVTANVDTYMSATPIKCF